MPRLIDETGNQYGRLIVLDRAESNKHGQPLWRCRCECGREVEVVGSSLRRGRMRSCGCLRKEKAVINEVGKTYGRLTVLGRVGTNNHRKATWQCRCECGKIVTVCGSSLRNGDTQSCGCLRNEKASERVRARALPTGETAFNQLILQMKHGARRRDYIWDLTNNQVRQLTSQSCFYCGMKPFQHRASVPGRNGTYVYNGLDRIDNTQGYLLENVVPCCGRCNKAKNIMTTEEFKAWVCRIYEHFGSEP